MLDDPGQPLLLLAATFPAPNLRAATSGRRRPLPARRCRDCHTPASGHRCQACRTAHTAQRTRERIYALADQGIPAARIATRLSVSRSWTYHVLATRPAAAYRKDTAPCP
jgi:hypothetical protein